jgi:hypothetical protein
VHPELEDRAVVIHVLGTWLPYEDRNGYTGELRSAGYVFVPHEDIERVADQDPYAADAGYPLLLDRLHGLALEQAGLAIHETRGGYHGTDAARQLLKWWAREKRS